MNTHSTFRPKLTFLSADDKDRIHRAALRILDDIGMKILHDEALSLLVSADKSFSCFFYIILIEIYLRNT